MNLHLTRQRCQMSVYTVIVYNLYYCCYAKTRSSAVQKRHSKLYGNPIAPSFYTILLVSVCISLSLHYSTVQYMTCSISKGLAYTITLYTITSLVVGDYINTTKTTFDFNFDSYHINIEVKGLLINL